MTLSVAPMPLFSQEFFDSVIDALAEQRNGDWNLLNADMDQDRRERDEYIANSLRSCALVCKSWYSRSVRHIWSHVCIDNSCSKSHIHALLLHLSSRWKLMEHIRHVDVHLSDEKADLSHPFLALCSLLPRVPSFRIQSLNDKNPFYDWTQSHISRAFKAICRSYTLTTFFYQGKTFPLQILSQMPKLSNISLAGGRDGLLVSEGQLPVNRPFRDYAQSLEMRLVCARFLHAEAVLMALAESAPQIFSVLEEFHLARRSSPPASDYAQAESHHAKIFSLAKNSLRRISLEAGKPLVYIKRFFTLKLDLADFQKLTHLTIHVDGAKFNSHHNKNSWEEVSGFLAKKRSRLPHLTSLEILLVGISYFDIGLATNPENAGWRLAKKYLAPKYLPSLKEYGVRGYWMHERPADVDENVDVIGDMAVSKAFETLFRDKCFPSWSGDTRNLKKWCNFQPDYEGRGSVARTPGHLLDSLMVFS